MSPFYHQFFVVFTLIIGCAAPPTEVLPGTWPTPKYAPEYYGEVKTCLERVRTKPPRGVYFLEGLCGISTTITIKPPLPVLWFKATEMTFQVRWFDQRPTPRIICSMEAVDNRFYLVDDGTLLECRPGGYMRFHLSSGKNPAQGQSFELLYFLDDDPTPRIETLVVGGCGPYNAAPPPGLPCIIMN
jgi:hypothetical protein